MTKCIILFIFNWFVYIEKQNKPLDKYRLNEAKLLIVRHLQLVFTN